MHFTDGMLNLLYILAYSYVDEFLMPRQKYRSVFLLIFLSLIIQKSLASSTSSFSRLTLSIMSYTTWLNTNEPVLCVINNPQIADLFQNRIQQLSYSYKVLAISSNNFNKSICHAVYFSNLSATQQHQLIQNYPSQALLSFSENNFSCEIGSIFCLYEQLNRATFKVNLDALSQTQIRIDPRVLLLARNTE